MLVEMSRPQTTNKRLCGAPGVTVATEEYNKAKRMGSWAH